MDLCNINEIKALLARNGFRFSKSMGQNFLIQAWVPEDIAAASVYVLSITAAIVGVLVFAHALGFI